MQRFHGLLALALLVALPSDTIVAQPRPAAPSPTPRAVTIAGRLLDADGAPVAHATITAGTTAEGELEPSSTTSADGSFRLVTSRRGGVGLRIRGAGPFVSGVVPVVVDDDLLVDLRIVPPSRPRAEYELQLVPRDTASDGGRVVAIVERMEQRNREHVVFEGSGSMPVDSAVLRDRRRRVVATIGALEAEIARERCDVIRHALRYEQLDLLWMLDDRALRSEGNRLRRRFIEDVPASSPLLDLHAFFTVGLMWTLGGDNAHSTALWRYVERIEREHQSEDLKSHLLHRVAETGLTPHDGFTRARADWAIGLLQSRYPHTVHARMWESKHGKALAPGRPIPDFALRALDDSSTWHERSAMLGSIYLVSLWGSWCGPCVAEMPELHEAYERFHPLGFDILSISFDAAPRFVRTFRQGEWEMPWRHAFADDGFDGSVATRFIVSSIPRSYLVDRDGTIIGRDLRGDSLIVALERAFDVADSSGTPRTR